MPRTLGIWPACAVAAVAALSFPDAAAFRAPAAPSRPRRLSTARRALKPTTPSEYALAPAASEERRYSLREKLLSVSGEDFTVLSESGSKVFEIVGTNKVPFGVGGVVLDKLSLRNKAGKELCTIERRLAALATAYDVYDVKGDLVCKVERDIVSLTPTYKFFYEAENNGTPCYKATGTFWERKFDVVGRDGKVVASVGRGFFEVSDRIDEYQLVMAAGVDPAAIIAMAAIIDEDHDEKDERQREKREEEKEEKGGGWLPW